MVKRLWFVILACFSVQAMAVGSVDNALILYVRVDSDGRGIIFLDRPIGGTPAGCVIPFYGSAIAFAADAGGKALLAAALSAKAQDRPVSITGKGTCTAYGSYVEDTDILIVR